jgi:hypothetical protein
MLNEQRSTLVTVSCVVLLLTATQRLHAQGIPMVACHALKTAFKKGEVVTPEPPATGESPEDAKARLRRDAVRQDVLEQRERWLKELTDPPPIPDVDCRIERGCLRIDWNIVREQKLDETLGLFRFSEKTPLKIYTSNFNFLQFSVNWTAKAEPQNPAFEKVSTLFDSIFPVLSLLSPGARALAGGPDASRWVVPLEYANNCLAEALSRVSGVVLDRSGDSNRLAVNTARHYIAQALPLLSVRRAEYLEDITGETFGRNWELYLKIAERHADFERRAAEFLPLAQRSVEGMMATIDPQPRNSVVTVTGQPSTRAGEAAGGAVVAKYFVATKRPLAYHVGYGYGRIRDFEFKQVRSAAGQDVFTAVGSETPSTANVSDKSSGADPIAFLTWEFSNTGPNGRYGVGLTLGTAMTAPHESLFLGGSLRMFTRVFVTSGVALGNGTRGEGPTTDVAADGTHRTVFTTLREVNDPKLFLSISFKVY